MGKIIKFEIPEKVYSKLESFLRENRNYQRDNFIAEAIEEAINRKSKKTFQFGRISGLDLQLDEFLGDQGETISVKQAQEILAKYIPYVEKLSDTVIEMREE